LTDGHVPSQQGGADRLGDPDPGRDLSGANHEGSGMTSNDRLHLPTASCSLATALIGGALARGLLH